jgi:hypothetical protein
VKDVSPGGVLLDAPGELQAGEELELEFAEEPWSGLGLLKGAVVWTQERGDNRACGVAFRDLTRQQERLLVHLVAQGLMAEAARGAEGARAEKVRAAGPIGQPLKGKAKNR